MPHVFPEGSLLDSGCGQGEWLAFLAEQTHLALTGNDISPVRLDLAKRKANGHDIAFEVGDITQLPYADGSFDQVTALETLEHIPNWEKAFSEIVRVASKRVVVTVPYAERIKYETCGNCGSEASLYGHLHSFKEQDFEKQPVDGTMSFEKLYHPHGLGHFIKRAIRGVSRKLRHAASVNETNGHTMSTVCFTCYEEVPYTKYFERAADRLRKLATRSPEYLLVTAIVVGEGTVVGGRSIVGPGTLIGKMVGVGTNAVVAGNITDGKRIMPLRPFYGRWESNSESERLSE